MRRLLLLPAVALVLVGTPVLALEQPAQPTSSTAGPAPTVTDVPLESTEGRTVSAGFAETVPVDASLVGVTWHGDPQASFTVEVQDASGTWASAGQVEAIDFRPDPGSADASRSAGATRASEPVWVRDAVAVRVRLDGGTASDIEVAAVDSTPGQPAPATTTAPSTTTPSSSTSSPHTSSSGTSSTGTTPPTTSATTSTTPPSTSALPPGTSAPPPDPGLPASTDEESSGVPAPQVAPPGSAGAADGWLRSITGPQRYYFAGALLALALVLGAVALGWSPWRRNRSRRVIVLVAAGALLLVACRPIPRAPAPTPPSGTTGRTAPAITLRSGWGAQRPACTNPNTNPMIFAVVHHTVNSNNYGPGESKQIVRNIQAYHQGTLGYCDIAYNFLIDRFGRIFEGRWGGITKAVLGAHTGGFNSHSTGVALIGDYRSATITTSQWNALVHLLQWKLSLHGNDATSPFSTTSRGGGSRFADGQVVVFGSRILGHTDLWPTACPGANVMSRLPSLRNAVQRGIVAPPTTTAPTTTSPST